MEVYFFNLIKLCNNRFQRFLYKLNLLNYSLLQSPKASLLVNLVKASLIVSQFKASLAVNQKNHSSSLSHHLKFKALETH
jgi:hypothetical protein